MKKILALLLTIVLLMTAVVACSNSDDDDDKDDRKSKTEKTEKEDTEEDDDEENSEETNTPQGTDANPKKIIKLGDFDNWAISIPDSVINGNDSEYAMKQLRSIFMVNVIKNSIEKGEIVSPDEFWEGYSMVKDSKCIDGTHDNCDKVNIEDKEGTNGLYTLGYIDVLEERFGTGNKTEIIKEITHPKGWLHPDYWTKKVNYTCDLFEAYIMNALWFTPEEFHERYNTEKNTIIKEKYDFVVEYIKDNYGIDLVGIAYGIKTEETDK